MDITLPSLLVTSAKSQLRLCCHAAAWSAEFGGAISRCTSECDGLVLLSATGPDTAVKAVRALLYQPGIEAEFRIEWAAGSEQGAEDGEDDFLFAPPTAHRPLHTPSPTRLGRARFADKPVSYQASAAKLAPGAVHLVALAKIPGLMPNLSDDHLWAELAGPRYSTPLLRPWIGWLKRSMIESGGILMAEGHNAMAGILTTRPEKLDEMVSLGVRTGCLEMNNDLRWAAQEVSGEWWRERI